MDKYVDDTIYIPVLQPGDKLYHYTSLAGLRGICGREFWVTERHFLNDTSEFQIATDIFCEMLADHISNRQIADCFADRLRKEVEYLQTPGRLGDAVAYWGNYVISFCLDEDSILMWSEYSDFMGYCMKFDFGKLLDSFEHKVFCHGKVVYDHGEQLRCMERTFADEFFNTSYDYLHSWEDLDGLSGEQIEELVVHASVICEMYNMFFKKPCFCGEHEYRMVFSCPHDGGRYKQEDFVRQFFRIRGEVLIPYVKEPFSSLDCLESVVIGPRNTSDIAAKGLEYFFRNEKLDIRIRQSEVPIRY